jgi:photosystem II stability/assembly factor-like uncharacterized protein
VGSITTCRARSRATPFLATALALVLVSMLGVLAAETAPAASSSSVVGATVPGATSISNQCLSSAARDLGPVTVSSSNLSSTGAGICRFGFGSSNSTASLRISQRDGSGTALGRTSPSLATSRTADPYFHTVEMATASVSFAARSDGLIIRTTDDGATWSSEVSGTTNRILSIAAADADTAYAAGNCGLFPCALLRKRTAGGGSTWAAQTAPVGTAGLVGVAVQPGNADAAIAVGFSGNIIFTSDGGTTWLAGASGTLDNLAAVSIISSSLAYAAGANGTLVRSTDGGATWSPVASTTGGSAIVDIAIAPGPNLYFATAASWFRSTNPAAPAPTIEDMGMPSPGCSMTSVDAPAAATVVLGGSYACGTFFITDALDPVPTATRIPTDSVAGTIEISAVSGTHAMVAGTGGELDRSVTGTNWETIRVDSARVLDIDGFGSEHAMAVGSSGQAWYTSDAGASWTTRPIGPWNDLIQVKLESPTEAWATSTGGRIYHTTDAGATWSVVSLSISNRLNDIARLKDGSLLVVGQWGYVARSSDDGATWQQSPWPNGNEVDYIAVDEGDGRVWIGGENGSRIGSSADFGRSFQNVNATPGIGTMNGIAAAGPGSAYAITKSQLFRTTDSGATWVDVTNTVLTFASAIETAGNGTIAISRLGGVTRSTDSGATWTAASGALRGTLDMVDANTMWQGYEAGGIWRLDPDEQVADYSGGAWGSAASAFGACLQAVGGAASEIWTVDTGGTPGVCEPSDADAWNAIPAIPTPIAETTSTGDAGSVDLVWGFRVGPAQTAGRYLASIDLTVVAPG